MTWMKADFRLGMYAKEFDFILRVFCWIKGKADFGSGEWGPVLQISEWGKVGTWFDTFNLKEMESLRKVKSWRGKETFKDPLQIVENIEN